MRKRNIYGKYIKRLLDIVLSVLLIFFLTFPMLLISVAIRAETKGGAIFRQKRKGRWGMEFTCYKFRTMDKDAPHEVPSSKLENPEKYITRVGSFLRKTSLDELPQLFNVLKGDMSIVGPRPLICEEKQMHEYRMREGIYTCRPGITGMAQISGRDYLRDEEKLIKDAYYVKNLRMGLDLKIIAKTFAKVLQRDDVEH